MSRIAAGSGRAACLRRGDVAKILTVQTYSSRPDHEHVVWPQRVNSTELSSYPFNLLVELGCNESRRRTLISST